MHLQDRKSGIYTLVIILSALAIESLFESIASKAFGFYIASFVLAMPIGYFLELTISGRLICRLLPNILKHGDNGFWSDQAISYLVVTIFTSAVLLVWLLFIPGIFIDLKNQLFDIFSMSVLRNPNNDNKLGMALMLKYFIVNTLLVIASIQAYKRRNLQ